MADYATIILPVGVGAQPPHATHSNEPQEKSGKVQAPKVDKLSVCLPIADQAARAALIAQLKAAGDNPMAGFKKTGKVAGYTLGLRAFLPLPSGGFDVTRSVHLLANPLNQSNSFLRLEWNPHRFDVAGHAYLKHLLPALLPGGYAKLLEGGKVTRVDVALDVDDVHIDNLVVVPGTKKAYQVWVGPDGLIETTNLGKPKGNQLVVYDLRKRLKKDKQPLPIGNLTRFEARVKTAIAFKELPTLNNPFAAIEVYDFSAYATALPYFAWFRDACRVRGIANALKAAGPGGPQFSALLKTNPPSWWKPNYSWNEWAQSLTALKLCEV